MKVLLTQHVKKLGRVGDIIEVADGFAVNSLFPQKKAVQATPKIINDHKMKQKASDQKESKLKEQTLSHLEKLEGECIVIEEKLNTKGSLYHAVGVKEIIKAIHSQFNISTPNTLFSEKYSLKEAGKHAISLEAYGKKVSVEVEIKSQ